MDRGETMTIDVPAIFIAGSCDRGIHQMPGAIVRMQGRACTRMPGCHLIDGAGHWVQALGRQALPSTSASSTG